MRTMKIISEDSGFKVELTIPDSLKRKGMNDKSANESANELINIAYKPFIDKITIFLAYAIGNQDFDSIDVVNDTIANIAKNKLQNR